jgi:hypothetical protein
VLISDYFWVYRCIVLSDLGAASVWFIGWSALIVGYGFGDRDGAIGGYWWLLGVKLACLFFVGS